MPLQPHRLRRISKAYQTWTAARDGGQGERDGKRTALLTAIQDFLDQIAKVPGVLPKLQTRIMDRALRGDDLGATDFGCLVAAVWGFQKDVDEASEQAYGLLFRFVERSLPHFRERCHSSFDRLRSSALRFRKEHWSVSADHQRDDPVLEEVVRACENIVTAFGGRVPPRTVEAKDGPREEETRPEPVARTRPGRPVESDIEADRRTYDAWMTGHYNTYAELARELGTDSRQVKLAIDRHRKRLHRAKEAPRDK